MLAQQDHPIRILMIDDHAVLRTGLRMIIESHIGMVVVGEAENRRESLAAIANATPDIILLDLDLGDENGLDLLPELIAAVPDVRPHRGVPLHVPAAGRIGSSSDFDRQSHSQYRDPRHK